MAVILDFHRGQLARLYRTRPRVRAAVDLQPLGVSPIAAIRGVLAALLPAAPPWTDEQKQMYREQWQARYGVSPNPGA